MHCGWRVEYKYFVLWSLVLSETEQGSVVGACYCMSCGLPLPMWSDEPDADLDYEAWLAMHCIGCGRTPRENGAK